MRCLYCHENIQEEINLLNLFKNEEPLCATCKTSLSYWREGRRCAHCHHLKSAKESACLDCLYLSKIYPKVDKVTCILDYNDDVKMLFHRFKFVKDAALAEVIAMFLKYDFREYDVIIPVPISSHRLSERGFNQTTFVLDLLKVAYTEALFTDKVKRQSELSKAQRLASENPFKFNADFNTNILTEAKVLIVDDIYTTGITSHQAAALIREKKPSGLDVLTFSKA